MYKELLKKIKKYNKIIITRHRNPDMDAIGSQVGLGELIKHNFKDKNVIYTGDSNKMDFENLMTAINPDDYKDALLIVCDVAVKSMIADLNYTLAKEVVVIDHHKNDCDLENVSLKMVDTEAEAAALIVADFAISEKLKINKMAADYMLFGIITDSGRFQYVKNAARLFEVATVLSKAGADCKSLYSWLYVESLADRKLKLAFENKIVYDENIAYIKTTKEEISKLDNIDIFKISRGMTNLMSGIDEIKIWANFTYNPGKDKIDCEFRSRDISIVDIAKKYGGGGHDNACGASVDDFNVVENIIKDFKSLLKKGE